MEILKRVLFICVLLGSLLTHARPVLGLPEMGSHECSVNALDEANKSVTLYLELKAQATDELAKTSALKACRDLPKSYKVDCARVECRQLGL